jgi:multiple sugar transport system permease protein
MRKQLITLPRGANAIRTRISWFRVRAILTTAIAAVLAIIFIWPFLCIVGATFKPLDAAFSKPVWPIPNQFSLKIYQLVFGEQFHFQDYIWNSIKVSAIATVVSVFASTLSGYALAKLHFPGRDLLFSIIIAVMLLPTTTMLVPQYVVMRDLKLTDTHLGLILPAMGGGAFGIFLMRQFMLGIPTEMLEAARLDGANEFALFSKIVLPNASAGIGVIATFSLRGNWNSLLWPQIMISDNAKQLLMPSIVMSNQMMAGPYNLPVVWAASAVAALVPLALYTYSQRYFVATFAGALKG